MPYLEVKKACMPLQRISFMASTFPCMRTPGTMLVCMYRSASAQSSGVWGSFILGRVVTGAVVGAETGAVVGAEAGAVVGAEAGAVVGAETGAVVGAETGAIVGAETGVVVGAETGSVVGTVVGN